ncbi:MAG: hypothetical protein OEM41_03250, partial [Ignavibacteria bacterium]|nr:hypothetical protein [Ignavibacteria bacterium]
MTPRFRLLSLHSSSVLLFLFMLSVVTCAQRSTASDGAALTFADMMHFRQIEHPVIANNGEWIAYTSDPDRGDGEVLVQSTGAKSLYTIQRGSRPVFSDDSRWVGVTRLPPAAEIEKHEKDKDKPKSGFVAFDLQTGDSLSADSVQAFAFSHDSRWLAYHKHKAGGGKKEKSSAQDTAGSIGIMPAERIGTDLILRDLGSGRQTTYSYVLSFAFDSTSVFLAYVRGDSSGTGNALLVVDLRRDALPVKTVDAQPRASYTGLRWSTTVRLACVRNPATGKGGVLPGA